MKIAVVAQTPTFANEALVRVGCHGADWCLLTPAEALETLGPRRLRDRQDRRASDARRRRRRALGARRPRGARRDGAERGRRRCSRPTTSCSPPGLLRRAGLPHPRTRLISGDRPSSPLRPPVVIKPRFGSWGLGVERCDDEESLAALLEALPEESWYRAHGALVQELVPTLGFDLRIVVADDQAIGAISRVAAPGEWRTNVALGAERRQATPPPDACRARPRSGAGDGCGARRGRPAPGRPRALDRGRDQRSGRVHGASTPFSPVHDPFAEAAFRLGRAAVCARLRAPAPEAPALHE